MASLNGPRGCGVAFLAMVGFSAAVQAQSTRTVTYLYTDPQGSVLMETDENGNVVSSTDYHPFGTRTTESNESGPGFTGHVQDQESELVYAQQRYFDPEAGRFLSVDPLGVMKNPSWGFNRYSYANNNPFKFIDPDGRYNCAGDPGKCKSFEQAMIVARAATQSSRLNGNEQKSLKEVTDFIGSSDDGNGVVVQFANDSSRGGYATFNEKTLLTTLTIRPDGRVNNLAKNAVHEGKHGLTDSKRRREDVSRLERLDNERGAYTTQAYFQKAAQYSVSSSDPWTFTGGISAENIEASANRSVNAACGTETGGSCGN